MKDSTIKTMKENQSESEERKREREREKEKKKKKTASESERKINFWKIRICEIQTLFIKEETKGMVKNEKRKKIYE